MTKKQIIEAVRRCAGKLKRNPTTNELIRFGISRRQAKRHFGSIKEMLRAAGLDVTGGHYKPALTALMLDWATVARKLGRAPMQKEYLSAGNYSDKPFISRFGRWSSVAENFLRLVREWNIQQDWKDVIEAISDWQRKDGAAGSGKTNLVKLEWNAQKGNSRVRLRARPGRAVCGAPMVTPGMIHEPANEDGVILLFGMLAERLGLIVRRVQGEFPDCEVLYETEPRRWINLFVEFEFESRNYAKHGHPKDGCDLLVCWIHNWPQCPADMEVLELKTMVGMLFD